VKNRNLNCLGTLWERTETQRDVLEAWFHRAYSPSVRFGYVTPILIIIAISLKQSDHFFVALAVIASAMLWLEVRMSFASGVAHKMIDGATHAETHVLCRSGQTIAKDQDH